MILELHLHDNLEQHLLHISGNKTIPFGVSSRRI